MIADPHWITDVWSGRLGAAGFDDHLPDLPAVTLLGITGTSETEADLQRARARVFITGDALILGPWGDKEPQACGQCLAIRWQRLRTRSEREALENPAMPTLAGPSLAVTEAEVAALVHTWDAVTSGPLSPSPFSSEWQTPGDQNYPQATRIDRKTLQVLTAPLIPVPTCPACQADRSVVEAPVPMSAQSRPKPAAMTFRQTAAKELDLPHGALANPIAGALGQGTWINDASPTTAPVAGSVFMRGHAGLVDVTWSGQGQSFEMSRKLALLEGLERYSGTHRRDPRQPVVATYNDVRDIAIDPESTGIYSDLTYETDPSVRRFEPTRPIPWVWGHSLRTGDPVLVPKRLVYYSAGLDADNFVFECSNGCATGSSIEEAALFGLLELVERDSFLLRWYGKLPEHEIDLDTCQDPAVALARARAGLLGYDIHVFDARVDLAVPAVVALAVRKDRGPGVFSYSGGASLNPAEAIDDAISEVLTYIPHLAGQVIRDWDELTEMSTDFSKVAHLPDHSRLHGLPAMSAYGQRYLDASSHITFDEFAAAGLTPSDSDLRDDLGAVVNNISKVADDVIVVDQTAPEEGEMGLTTVATLAPGLLPIDFGWNRQRALTMSRLRTAFRGGGLRDTDLREEEILRVPHPFP